MFYVHARYRFTTGYTQQGGRQAHFSLSLSLSLSHLPGDVQAAADAGVFDETVDVAAVLLVNKHQQVCDDCDPPHHRGPDREGGDVLVPERVN